MSTLAANKDFSRMPNLSSGHTTNADNPFEPFFGPTSVQDGQGVKAGDVFSHETYNLPDAYKGKSAYMEDIMDWLITRTDEWYTSRVCPWRMTDQISVQWNVWRFNRTMADLEPHQGVPRYVTAESEERSDRLVRRGLAFIIEHGFWTTDRGRKHYLTNLEQITSAVHETAYYGVLHALLAGKNHWKEWNRQYGRRTTRIDDLLRMDRNRWALCQKTPRGMFLLDASLKDMLSHQGITPDTWILPSKVGIYLSMVPSNQTSFQESGPTKAVADNNSNSASPQKLATFRGSTVCETRPFDMDFSGEPVELLRREKMIGEYYTMLAHDSPSTQQYRTDHRSIFMYNCDVDRFEKVGIEDAIKNCFRWGVNDSDLTEGPVDGDHDYIMKGYGVKHRAKDVSLYDDPLLCHHTNGLTDIPDGICTRLGDICLDHFSDADVRDWAETVKRAARNHAGIEASVTGCNTFLKQILQADYVVQTFGSNSNSGFINDPDTYSRRLFNSVDLNEPLISALQDSWDPQLASAVLGDDHPQMAYIPRLSSEQIERRFHSGFPDMWKAMVQDTDFVEVRNNLVNQVNSAATDGDRLNILKRANSQYETALTERSVSRRSKLSGNGQLDRAMMELQAPAPKKSRAAGLKETRAFLDKFTASVQYAQQLNEERSIEPLGFMQEMVRDYVQPLNAQDAQEMEARIESHVEAGNVLTPQLLDQWKQEIGEESVRNNLQKLASQLTPAGAQASSSRQDARTDRDKYRKKAQTDYYADAENTRTTNSKEYTKRNNSSGSVNDDFRKMFANIKLNRRVLEKFAEYDILVPFGFLVVRPFIRYDMASGILCQSGSDLGQTFMGHADFQLTDDIIHKVHVGHYTFYSKTIIHNEKKYTIAEDIFAAGYKGGENTRFYRSVDDLSADIHAEAFRASCISHLIPYRTNQGGNSPRIQNPIDITGRLHPTLYQDTDIPEMETEMAMYPGAKYLCEKLELRKMTSYTSDSTEHFLSPFKYLNTVAFQGPQYYFSNLSGRFARIEGTGHWGNNAYNGCKGVRCGDLDFFRDVATNDESPI